MAMVGSNRYLRYEQLMPAPKFGGGKKLNEREQVYASLELALRARVREVVGRDPLETKQEDLMEFLAGEKDSVSAGEKDSVSAGEKASVSTGVEKPEEEEDLIDLSAGHDWSGN